MAGGSGGENPEEGRGSGAGGDGTEWERSGGVWRHCIAEILQLKKKKAIVLQRVVAWACAAVCTVHSEKGVCIMSLTA